MFSRFFIYRPIFASVVSIVIVLAGGISIPFLPVEQTPNITPPTVDVTASYPGASATVIAEGDATAFRFPSDLFNMLVDEESVAAYKLIHAMAKSLCVRQRQMNQKLTDLLEAQHTASGVRGSAGSAMDEKAFSE